MGELSIAYLDLLLGASYKSLMVWDVVEER